MPRRPLSRRDFVARTGRIAFGAMVVPRRVLGRGAPAPSDTLNVGIIGAGGMGMSNAEALVSQNLVALCDVDFGYVERQLAGRGQDRDGQPRPDGLRLQEQFARATRYADFREMLERQRDLDAVVIATPDHTHAVIAKAAMELGRHVYVQKPLTWSVYEARVLAETARRTGVVTQMGNQGHSSDDARLVNEWVQAGILGPVRQVLAWTNRPIWPQGIPWPAPRPADAQPNWGRSGITALTAAGMAGEHPAPEQLRWDLYVGPVAEDVPYHPAIHPFNWRGWVPFGVGALGDMGAHLLDHPFWALNLGYPATVEATSTPWGGGPQHPATYPLAMTAHYEFPARGARPAVRLDWYDGGLMPARPAQLPDDVALEREGGVIYVGERGILLHETYGRNPRLWPESLREEAARVPRTMPRISTSHELNWAEACKGNGSASSPFSYAGPLTEVMLLGIVALRAGQGKTIRYDAERMTITNAPDADPYLSRPYRAGWAV